MSTPPAGTPMPKWRQCLKRVLRAANLPFRKLNQWWCGVARGHSLGNDRGLALGGKKVDRWCAHCNKHIQIPLAEEDYGEFWG